MGERQTANMCDDDDKPAVIMDNGTGMMKCGLSGEDAPKVTCASCVGYPKQKAMLQGSNKDYYVGEEAQQKRGILLLKYPLEHGVITNWDVAGVLLTEAPMNPKENREKMTQIMFETFSARRFYVAIQAVLSLYASAERESAKRIKEDLCYISMNFAEEVDNFAGKEKTFELPDMSIVTVHNQIIRCPELMFKPSLDGKEMMGLHELTKKTIDDCDLDVRKDLLANIVMSGGTTMFPNMPERLQAEVEKLVAEGAKVKVIAPPERMISVWIGGSILASLSTFSRMWINQYSQPDASPPITGYDEVGPRIVHQMCNS